MTPTSHYLVCQGRELHVTAWGDPQADVVVAWHGLARTGRDMDDIAAHLAQRWRVFSPDTLGRRLSRRSPAPDDERGRIQRLAMNDIGPTSGAPAAARIRSRAGSRRR